MNLLEMFRKNEKINFPFYGLTRSKTYKKYLDFFENAIAWNQNQIEEWQFDKVKEILVYAYEHVPFYRMYYDQFGIVPYSINSWEDFREVPCIDKAMIKANGELFYSDEKDVIGSRFDYTGGSTGQPLKFLIDNDIYQREDAIYRLYWRRVGFNVGDKCIILRGRKIYTDDNKKIYEYNQFWNYMYLDSAYLSNEFFMLYDEAIRKYNAKVIQAYPSSLILLARLYEVNKKEAPCFNLIFLGSENVDKGQIQYLKRIFNCSHIYNQYGHSEKAALALQIPDGESMAFVPFYGYFELLNENNSIIQDTNSIGEIVATGFSKSMPFIRYKTSDMAYLSEEETDSYMKYWKKIKGIEGRLHEFIYTKSGRKISICTVGGAHISELNNVIDMQYEQFVKGELIVNIISESIISESEKCIIEKKYEELFDGDIKCQVCQVDKLRRTGRDKKIMLVQHVAK